MVYIFSSIRLKQFLEKTTIQVNVCSRIFFIQEKSISFRAHLKPYKKNLSRFVHFCFYCHKFYNGFEEFKCITNVNLVSLLFHTHQSKASWKLLHKTCLYKTVPYKTVQYKTIRKKMNEKTVRYK